MEWAVRGFRVVERIGAGGMAELFLAERSTGPQAGEKVAIKRILPAFSDDPTFVEMFREEMAISRQLHHPNIVRTLEVSTREDDLYLVMELVDGETARVLLRSTAASTGGPGLSVADAVRIGIGVADGLHHAHETTDDAGHPLRIVHRDVSPQNVMVTVDGGVKLLDFGIAKTASRSSETRHGTLKGKIPYMSPEQTAGEALDRRSDVYASGVLLYELTVGRRPHQADSDFALIRMIQQAPIPPPSRFVPGYPEGLHRILRKAMASRRGQRYQTASQLAADLRRFAVESGIDVGPRSLVPLVGAVRENPRPAAGPEPRRSVAPRRLPVVAGAAVVTRRRVGEAWLVTVDGRLTERFDGTELARDLDGVVVLDLARVERVTSFGVREWVLAMEALTGRVEALILARCSVAIANQLTMIGGFAGPGVVSSFQAPYHCRACSTSFERLIDGRLDGEALRAKTPPATACPKCGGAAELDDDPGFFRVVANLVTDRIHPQAEAALRTLSSSDRPAVEKRIEAEGTRLVVNARIEPTMRWSRLLDGVEGELSVELGEADGAAPTAVAVLARALAALGPEVEPITAEGVPMADAREFQRLAGRVGLRSVVVDARCPRCDGVRRVWVSGGEVGTCSRCGDVCDVSQHRDVLRDVFPAAIPPEVARRWRVPLVMAAVTVLVAVGVAGVMTLGAGAATLGWLLDGR